jgi:hypothetical protein
MVSHEWFQDNGYSQRRVRSRLTTFKEEGIHKRTFLQQLVATTVAVGEDLDDISRHVFVGVLG